MEQFKQILDDLMHNNNFLIGVIVVCVALLIFIFMFMYLNKKDAKKQLNNAETRYNSIKSIPLTFKVSKAESLSRVNSTVAERVDKCKLENQNVQDALKEYSILLGEIDDLIYVHKISSAKKQLKSLNEKLLITEKEASNLNAVLDSILEQESNQRDQINRLKTQFRVDKEVILTNRNNYNSGIDVLEDKVLTIEKMFSNFEEWMFASEFNKASQQQSEISEAINELELLMNEYPELYIEAKKNLPKSIDETSYIYSLARNKGVYLEHLEVSRNLESISTMLKDDLNRLGEGQVEGVFNSLTESKKRLNQLKEQVLREEKAFDELNDNVNFLFEQIVRLGKQNEAIKQLYESVKDRFGFDAMQASLSECDAQIAALEADRDNLKGFLMEKTIPASTLLITYRDLSIQANQVIENFDKMKSMLENACQDEKRAKKQLLKLQLILNEINVKMSKNRLPSVSVTYEEDARKAKTMVKEIESLLESTPINVAYLNEKIQTAIDFIYTLYNSVNNLVGMAIMVENVIVFGNRYRSTHPEVDSELTHAELCFRNGQYTKALKIAIQTIEKLHPGSYEKLIKRSQGVN